MSYNKNDNDLNNVNISKISQIHLNNQEKLKQQKEFLQESGYSSETDPDIIENTGMDFDYSQEDDVKNQKKNVSKNLIVIEEIQYLQISNKIIKINKK